METFAVEKWLKETLAADSLLTALVGTHTYSGVRAKGSPLPCVVYQLQAPGNDMVMMGGVRVWANMLYLVRGIAEQPGYGGKLLAIADRIDAALHKGSGSNVNGVIYTCVRERPFQLREETRDGSEFRHLGGLYRIQAR